MMKKIKKRQEEMIDVATIISICMYIHKFCTHLLFKTIFYKSTVTIVSNL